MHAIEVNSLGMPAFLQIFVYKVIQKKQKNNNNSQSTALHFNDRQIFHIHTVAFQ